MMNGQPITYSFREWCKDSTFLGAKTAFIVSIYFTCWATVGEFVHSYNTRFFSMGRIEEIALLGGLVFFVICVIIVPIITLCISTLLWIIRKQLSTFKAIAVGVAIGFAFTAFAGITSIMQGHFQWSTTLWATIAAHTRRMLDISVYIVIGGCVGWRLFKILLDKNQLVQPQSAGENS